MVDIIRGSIISVISTVNPGAGETVSAYRWTMDGTVLPDISANITIDTSTMSLGNHNLLLEAQNSCGNWGSYSEIFTIIEAPTTGSISFASTPSGASIYLDNILQTGTTPTTITNVPPGSHTYLLRLSGYNDATGTVTVTAGQTATVSATLTPVVTTGSISFASSPSGASIYLDNVLQTGTTPRTITGVPAGSHTYLLRLSGYNDATGTVTVTAGQTVTISAVLTPVPTYEGWIDRKGGVESIVGNLSAIGEIIDGYLGMADLGFMVNLGNVGTTIDYYLGL